MDTSDVKDMAENTGRRIKDFVEGESPVEKIRGAAQQADETLRSFAKDQPALAIVMALGVGYFLGHAVARVS